MYSIKYHVCMYVQYKVNVSENQVDTLKDAIRLKKCVTLCFPNGGIRGDHFLLQTPAQLIRLEKAQVQGKRIQIRLSARNVSYISLLSGGINKAMRGKGVGDGFYLHKHDKFYRVQ